MSAEFFFLDTNVLVYTFDSSQPEKQTRARDLVETALEDQKGLISYQVVQEFLNLATRRFPAPMTPSAALDYLQMVLSPLCAVFPNIGLYERAIALHERRRYSFYDSLIVGAALEAECTKLYSEDLHDGHEIEGLTIVNPFRVKTAD